MGTNNISNEEREKLFGTFKWTKTNGDNIDIQGDWVEKNIETIKVPQLVGIATDGGKFSGNVQFNKKAIPQLLAAFADIEAAGLKKYLLTFDGAFVSRLKRNGTTPSNHAYGSAIDLNCTWNWLGDEPAKPGHKGDLHLLVPIFKTHGFYWGGDWSAPKDGMHFEVGRLINYEAPAPLPVEQKPRGPMLVILDDWRNAMPLTIEQGQSFVSGKTLYEYLGEKWEGADRKISAGQTLTSFKYRYKWDNDQKKLYAFKA